MRSKLPLLLAIVPIIPSIYLYQRLSFVGAFRRTFTPISALYAPEDYFDLPIGQVEDLAYHHPSGLIFSAGQGNVSARAGWFPPWANFDRPDDAAVADGGLWVIDSETWSYERLELRDFTGPFVTHGIDIWYDAEHPHKVWLHVVNHIPHVVDGVPQPFSDSRIEVFTIDTTSRPLLARHVRTLKHALVHTPNDIYSLGPTDLLVTNDHVNTRGPLRMAEDLLTFSWTSRTTIVRLHEEGAEVVASGLHNANGLAHGPDDQVVLGDAAGGDLTLFNWTGSQLVQTDYLSLGIQLDNPTFFADRYASASDDSDASGYLLGGLLTGINLDRTCRDPYAKVPSSVWIARRSPTTGKLQKTKLLEDDGGWVSGASVALVMPVEPSAPTKKKEAWMLVTGPFSLQVGVVKVDLSSFWT